MRKKREYDDLEDRYTKPLRSERGKSRPQNLRRMVETMDYEDLDDLEDSFCR